MNSTWNKNNKQQTSQSNTTPAIIGWGAGITAGGMGAIDIRPKPNYKNIKHLGSTWQSVQKYVEPGDIIIGSNTTAPELFKEEIETFKKNYKKFGLKKAIKRSDLGSAISKIGDPIHSHAAMFTGEDLIAFGGGPSEYVSREIYITPGDLRKSIKTTHEGTTHYLLVRPKEIASDQYKELMANQGGDVALQIAGKRAGKGKNYKESQGIAATARDWFLPKLNIKEKLKTQEQMAVDRCTVGGVCSTLPATFSNATVGGKQTKNVLPADFLRSPNYKIIGSIGNKPSTLVKKALPFSAVKWGFRGAIGAGIGTAAYQAVKAVKKQTEKSKK
jgi:hypothetical protein